MGHTFFVTRGRLVGLISVVALLAVAIFLPGGRAFAGDLGPGGTFTDDDGNTHEGMIEAIVAEGITLGCNVEGTLYCPADFVRRDQMASFLKRALGLPDSVTDWFSDDNGNTHEGAINSIADAGVTLGFPDGTYDPSGLVSREQMASFLKRALGLPDGVDDGSFTDVTGGPHVLSIYAIRDAGITVGCNVEGTLYCPGENVRRDQMASFLGRGLDLDPIIPPPPTTTTTTTTMATTTTTMGSGTLMITLQGATFSPSDPPAIALGTEVTFDNVSGNHDLIWENGPYPGEAPPSSGWDLTFTADTAGTFDFYCSVHGSPGTGMRGTIVVNP